jgi:hypothetical protein
MADKPIQEQFGERVIGAFAEFARADLEDPDTLEKQSFSHVRDARLRKELAQVLYGARWFYKLGLALLTKDEERAAHVRAQIVDYASVCEALLSYCIAHAIRGGHTKGNSYQWADPDIKKKQITWQPAQVEKILARQSLWWLVRIAGYFGIISVALGDDLNWLRNQRNTVHLRQRVALGRTAFLNQSKRAFEITVEVVQATKIWKAAAT